jgi:dTDP-N-acetylfucosamine:lipid II N-acetylfucosaminyltransferase
LQRDAGFPCSHVQWNYWVSALAALADAPAAPPAGRGIMVGNSATPENNHLEVFNHIQAGGASERPILCPLSYGRSAYGDFINQEGARRFGSRFEALRRFLDQEAFIRVASSCSILALNHLRQQAVGTIFIMLWLGAEVYLNSRSPVFGHLLSLGLDVRDIETLAADLENPPAPASPERIASRRAVLWASNGWDALLDRTRHALR